MLTLKNLKSPKGAHRNVKRIGRGEGSGWGTQAAKGHKGQKARSGGGAAVGFEGGQMPLYRRLPKRGFSNYPFRTEYAEVTLKVLDQKFDNEAVNKETLISKGILKGAKKNLPIKILGNQNLSKALTFEGDFKFTTGAKEQILAAGGKID